MGEIKQSRLRERIKRMVREELPDFEIGGKYPVLCLRPHQREGDRPAWSVGAIRKSDGRFFDVYSQDTMGDCVLFGIKAYREPWDQAVMIAANRDGTLG